MSARRISLVVGTAAGAFLATGLSPIATTAVAHADGDDSSASVDIVPMSHTDDFGLFTMTAPADPDDNFVATTSQIAFPDVGDIATAGSGPLDGLSDTGFISNMTDFGLFNITTAADPDEDFIAFVLQIPSLDVTDVLTSGADPADHLGLGEAGIGIAGSTVNTLLTPIFDSTFAIPVEDPFADLFTLLVQLGF